MFKDSAKRLDVIKMCDDCRVAVDGGGGLRSVRRAARAPVRTTDDYLRERETEGATS